MAKKLHLSALSFALAAAWPAAAETEQKLPAVEVEASRTSQLGLAESANAGVVTQEQLAARTVYRPGELLEATPGLIVSQHSGEGKANQFYLRGFNLDHGTDLRTTVDGMPVNQRSHAHGQGWSDMNFLIPELVTRLEYRKGPYYAGEGDFASAGALALRYADKLEGGIASASLGQYGHRRALLADSPDVGAGRLLYAIEAFHNDGPFTRGDDYRKFNAVLRYSQGDLANGFNLSAMAYRGRWNATDQIPQRALEAGTLGRFDAIDGSDGGSAHRYSLSAAMVASDAGSVTRANAWLAAQELALYSNFTYFLDDPVNGDQFAQPDRRVTAGLNASRTWSTALFGVEGETTLGLQLQNDNIFNGLYSTAARRVIATTRADHIVEGSAGIYLENLQRWNSWLRSSAGLRLDSYRFEVRSERPQNSGTAQESIASPKLGLVFGPWQKNELYLNFGSGFHSNDARGTVIAVDPKSGAAADRVTPLVRARGMELGLRSEAIAGLQSSLSVYRLDFDSELLFVGDAGTTEASRPSRRVGFEFSNYYKPNRWLTVDLDLAYARARFRNADAVGDRIPGAVEGVASLALAVDHVGPYFGALQLRYFGPRPLVEDNSVRSHSTSTLNGRIGYRLAQNMSVELEAFNMLNRQASAIDYFYASRLKGEAAAVDDIHFHPIESRSLRLSLNLRF